MVTDITGLASVCDTGATEAQCLQLCVQGFADPALPIQPYLSSLTYPVRPPVRRDAQVPV